AVRKRYNRERRLRLIGGAALFTTRVIVLAHRRVGERERELAVRRDLSRGGDVGRIPRTGDHLRSADEATRNPVLGRAACRADNELPVTNLRDERVNDPPSIVRASRRRDRAPMIPIVGRERSLWRLCKRR